MTKLTEYIQEHAKRVEVQDIDPDKADCADVGVYAVAFNEKAVDKSALAKEKQRFMNLIGEHNRDPATRQLNVLAADSGVHHVADIARWLGTDKNIALNFMGLTALFGLAEVRTTQDLFPEAGMDRQQAENAFRRGLIAIEPISAAL